MGLKSESENMYLKSVDNIRKTDDYNDAISKIEEAANNGYFGVQIDVTGKPVIAASIKEVLMEEGGYNVKVVVNEKTNERWMKIFWNKHEYIEESTDKR